MGFDVDPFLQYLIGLSFNIFNLILYVRIKFEYDEIKKKLSNKLETNWQTLPFYYN